MKRIITCSDGTWNKPNTRENGKVIKTNVQKLFDCIHKRDTKGTPQVKFYDPGIGSSGNILVRMLNGATGKGIDENILDVYRFICWNYEPGDAIYLFGFSRGAYTARSLAGLIRKCGIIKTNDLDMIAEAYALYRNRKVAPDDCPAVRFRRVHSYDVRAIKFIGVWDTVGSLGLPLHSFQWYNKRKYAFYDTTLSSIVEHACHALAVDEKRKTFEPAWWVRSHRESEVSQTLEQRWFPGVHSNVGGGYPDCSLSDIPLRWLFRKAHATGLHMDETCLAHPDACDGVMYNSLNLLYRLLGKRDRKIIVDNVESFIDESVFKRMEALGPAYQPANVLEAIRHLKAEASEKTGIKEALA